VEELPRIEEIQRLLDIADVEWVDPCKEAVFIGVKPSEVLRPRRMLRVKHRYYFETEDKPGTWWLGTVGDDGVVGAWGNYGPFEQAIHNR
jgi:hypothetical protein